MSLRKTETLITAGPDENTPGPAFTFQRLTFAGELKFRGWCEQKKKRDNAAGLLDDKSKGSGCGLTDAYGASQALEGEGMRVFLKLAGDGSGAALSDELLYDLQADYYMELFQIVLNLLPIGPLVIANLPDKLRASLPNLKGPA